jgi:hypothetical protein
MDAAPMTERGRLTMREEGAFLNAYLTAPGATDGELVGSIRRSVVRQNSRCRALFFATIREASVTIGGRLEEDEKGSDDR